MKNPKDEKNNREIIIRQSSKLIAENGFDRLKFSDIAESTNISRVTIRKYFKTKADILAEIFSYGWESIMRLVNEEIQKSIGNDEITLIKKIFSLVVTYLSADENKDIAFVLLFESRQIGIITRSVYPHPREIFILLLRRLIKAAQDKMFFSKELEPEEIETMIWAVMEEALYRNYLYKYRKEIGFSEQLTKRAIDYNTIEQLLKLLEQVLKKIKGSEKRAK